MKAYIRPIAAGMVALALTNPVLADDHPVPLNDHAVNMTHTVEVHDALEDSFPKWEGTEYEYGGLSTDGVDCSGYVHMMYKEALGYDIPRSTEILADMGEEVDEDELRPGDLVFFKTSWKVRHVGIYAGDGVFMHASSSRGVMKSRLDNVYWDDVFWKAVRL